MQPDGVPLELLGAAGVPTESDAPVGLQAAAASMAPDAPATAPAAPPPPPPMDYAAVTRTSIAAIGKLLGKLGPELALDATEIDALSTVWTPVVADKLPQASPVTAAMVITGTVFAPKVGELIVRRRGEARAAAAAKAQAAQGVPEALREAA